MKIIGSDISRQNFKELNIYSFDELIAEIESGLIVCPMPPIWVEFYDRFIAQEDPKRKLLPLILSSWGWTSDEEKNERWKSCYDWVRNNPASLWAERVLLDLKNARKNPMEFMYEVRFSN